MCLCVCRRVLFWSFLPCEFHFKWFESFYRKISTFLILTPRFPPYVFLFISSSVSTISQVSVGTRQTWSVGTKRSAITSSPRRRPRLSWSSCGRPYRTSLSSSWRPPPSSPSACLSTSLQEGTPNVRRGAGGVGHAVRPNVLGVRFYVKKSEYDRWREIVERHRGGRRQILISTWYRPVSWLKRTVETWKNQMF